MKYIYGPVQSRRLGLSLGISLTPHKVCNFDCIYCQLGRTISPVRERAEYVKISDILDELSVWVSAQPDAAKKIAYITLSGAGEPTLNTAIGELISCLKLRLPAQIAVITNSSCFTDPLVRKAVLGADLIVPSLDAATETVFRRIDRPVQGIKIADIIDGLVALRKEFRGKMWLEIMLVKGVNDSPAHIKRLKEAIDRINPDKVQLNSPVRTTAEDNVMPLTNRQLEKIRSQFGDTCEVV